MAVFRTLPRRRNRRPWYLLTVIVVYVLWCEFVALYAKGILWKIPNQQNTLKFLLVADPQLIGYRNEKKWIGWLSRADSDRYIQRAFAHAFYKVAPDYVVFLGDLFDEGVQMSALEFEWTMHRFNTLFPINNKTNRCFVPGDNDVGGEMEPVYEHLKTRFAQQFSNFFLPTAQKIFEFSTINLFDAGSKIEKISKSDGLKILMSHYPVIRSIQTTDNSFGGYRPDLILSAHDHTGEFYVKKRGSENFSRFGAEKGLKFSITSGMPLVEIQVPTMNYRMGVPDMAIGLLSVETVPNTRSFTIQFENLWLPGRYPQLYGYVILIIIVFFYYFAGLFWSIARIFKIDQLLRFVAGRAQRRYVPV
ncbi:Metallophos domain-containing protein [Aphelenchoides besseyi]|nr:Metallophos domain-containing protein [Aphelenchoides besseyi]